MLVGSLLRMEWNDIVLFIFVVAVVVFFRVKVIYELLRGPMNANACNM